jgi:hypothetical protein
MSRIEEWRTFWSGPYDPSSELLHRRGGFKLSERVKFCTYQLLQSCVIDRILNGEGKDQV